MTLYFAYGSNMSRVAMKRRCPQARALGVATLAGWRFIVTLDGYASVVRAAGSEVIGVLWDLTARDLAALNAYETLHSGLYRRRTLPVRLGRGVLPALTYIGRTRSPGRAKIGYQDGIVLPSARDWGLPKHYIAELIRWTLSASIRRSETKRGAVA
jgi:hypothetical protein